jgi:glycolate oxidase iron-sulfur subunit
MGARGRLVLLWGLASGTLSPSLELNERIFSCTLCGACSDLCPAGVDIKELIYHGRTILMNHDKKRSLFRRLLTFSLTKPKVSLSFLRFSQHILVPQLLKKGLIPF